MKSRSPGKWQPPNMRVLVDICMEVCVDGGLVQSRATPRATGQSNAGGQESVGLVFENELFYFALNCFHTPLHQQQPAL
jgi:hypothetical protein